VRAGFGQDVSGLRIQLTAFATLRGKVLDPDGNPVPGASVNLGAGMETTDDEGSFVFQHVAPGSYAVTARGPGEKGEVEQQIRIGSREIAVYEFRLRSVSAFRVRGVVRDSEGRPVPGVTVTVTDSTPPAGPPATTSAFGIYGLFQPGPVRYFIIGRPRPAVGEFVQPPVTTSESGTFEFTAVRAGTFQFGVWRNLPFGPDTQAEFFNPHIEAYISANSPHGSFRPDAETGAPVDRDTSDLEIKLPDATPPFTLSGSAELQDSHDIAGNWRASVSLASESTLVTLSATLKPDGTLRIENVTPGKYRILPVPALQSGGYLSSVLLGDRDVTGQSVYLAPGSRPIRVIYKTNGGGVRGKVENGANATVVLIPQTSLSGGVTDYGWLYHCEPDGTFALTSLRPGTYYALALDVSPTKLPDIEVLRGLLSSSVSVQIDEGGMATADLKMTHVPQ